MGTWIGTGKGSDIFRDSHWSHWSEVHVESITVLPLGPVRTMAIHSQHTLPHKPHVCLFTRCNVPLEGTEGTAASSRERPPCNTSTAQVHEV